MITIDEKIRAAIKVECDRQHVGEDRQEMLYLAYRRLHSMIVLAQRAFGLTEFELLQTAKLIEPSNQGRFRTTPVSFNGIVGGVPPENLERSIERWIEYFNATNSWMPSDTKRVVVEEIIKEFLDIHPFSDGNGRTAWLLRVWMLNQWDDPQPLPDYYETDRLDEISAWEAMEHLDG